MASERRPAGLLRQAIVDVMDSSRPERAAAIMDKLHRAGLPVQSSLFFRDLAKLVARGTVIRVNIARGYMLAPVERRILLFCRECGQVSTIGLDPVFDEIADLAQAHRFRVSRSVVEVAGVCSICARSAPATIGGATSSEPAGAVCTVATAQHPGHRPLPGDDRPGDETAEFRTVFE